MEETVGGVRKGCSFLVVSAGSVVELRDKADAKKCTS